MAHFVEVAGGDGIRVLRVVGEVDLAVADQFVDAARACLGRGDGIEIDLSEVSFIDSSGLGALVRLRNESAQQAKSLALTNPSAIVDRLLQVTGLHEAFNRRSDPS